MAFVLAFIFIFYHLPQKEAYGSVSHIVEWCDLTVRLLLLCGSNAFLRELIIQPQIKRKARMAVCSVLLRELSVGYEEYPEYLEYCTSKYLEYVLASSRNV